MNYIRNKIQSAMMDDGGRGALSGFLLQLSAHAYGAGLKGLQGLYGQGLLKIHKLPCRVVSIGNITVGGTGKTPMAIYTARLVQALGYRVAVVSRGYKGAAEKSGGIVSDGRRIRMTPKTAGDEPYLLAQSLKDIPVLVGRDRFQSGMTAIREFATEVVMLDDAFQHIRLERDIDLVLLDDRRPFGNGRLLPRGALREPADALRRCDAVILTRCLKESTATYAVVRKMFPRRPVFKSRHVPAIVRVIGAEGADEGPPPAMGPNDLKRLRVFAFSGLADNRNFRDSLTDMGCQVSGRSGFPDHHPYTEADLNAVLHSARESGAEALATTEKDFTKISGRIRWPLKLIVIGVQASFGEEAPVFRDFIRDRLAAFRA